MATLTYDEMQDQVANLKREIAFRDALIQGMQKGRVEINYVRAMSLLRQFIGDALFRTDDELQLEAIERVMSMSVWSLDVGGRVIRCLLDKGLETVADVVQCTAEELLEIKYFGIMSLEQLRQLLSGHGVALRGDMPPNWAVELLAKYRANNGEESIAPADRTAGK